MPQLSLSQEPNYLINTTTESSGADAEKSESTCRAWNCRGRQGRQWQGERDVIACTFGHMSIHHGKVCKRELATQVWGFFSFCTRTAQNSIFSIIIMDFYKAVDPVLTTRYREIWHKNIHLYFREYKFFVYN